MVLIILHINPGKLYMFMRYTNTDRVFYLDPQRRSEATNVLTVIYYQIIQLSTNRPISSLKKTDMQILSELAHKVNCLL